MNCAVCGSDFQIIWGVWQWKSYANWSIFSKDLWCGL